MLEHFNLDGRKAIVTGGGGDIGGGLAAALYQSGADVALVGRSENIDTTAAKIGAPERPVHTVRADLTDRKAVVASFHESVEKLGGIDILVTCHGVVYPGDALDYEVQRWDEVIELNLDSIFILCQLAGRKMIASGYGKIINIASMLSFSGGIRVAAYAASKGGVAQLTKALANEWAGKGVNVNAIAPGYIRTKLNPHIWKDPVRHEEVLKRIPAGRLGDPADLQGAVVFLASHASDYLHGVILPVDGGYLAR